MDIRGHQAQRSRAQRLKAKPFHTAQIETASTQVVATPYAPVLQSAQRKSEPDRKEDFSQRME